MFYLPLIALIFICCALGAYGIQKRQKWVWYAGLVFQFITAGGISTLLLPWIVYAENLGQLTRAIVALIGSASIWVSWAYWWSVHRHEFSKENPCASR